MLKRLLYVAAASLAFTGCTVMSVPLGTTRDEVLKQMGSPSNTVALASGTRLQYSRQPAGQTAVMVDLDAAGRVVSVRQVLKLEEFTKIEVGKWSRADVEREFGRPALINHFMSWKGDVMTYRWRDDTGQNMFYWVYLDEKQIVQQVGQSPEPEPRGSDSDSGGDRSK
jgi:hypothetical protein